MAAVEDTVVEAEEDLDPPEDKLRPLSSLAPPTLRGPPPLLSLHPIPITLPYLVLVFVLIVQATVFTDTQNNRCIFAFLQLLWKG